MGNILSIKRFEIHDGDGIRTTLFLKGCPLHCLWCHNPESFTSHPVLAYNPQKCLNCGECANSCDCHKIKEGLHFFDRQNCNACGKCTEICLGEALTLYGRQVTAKEILPALLEDKPYFDKTGGGVTVSGGEPLMQADFTAEIFALLKEKGVNTALDTCGYAPPEQLDKVLPFTDTVLFDLKTIDPEIHKFCTGVTNEIILDNLKYIDSNNIPIEIRIPLVPTLNDGEIYKIGEFLSTLKNITMVKVLAYHNFAVSKYKSLGMEYPLNITPPDFAAVDDAVKILKKYNLNAINGMRE